MTELLKLLVLFTFFFSSYNTSSAQVASVAADTEMIYRVTEKAPRPVGGMTAFYEYTQDNLRRPSQAVAKGIRGNVFVKFIIEKDGSITNVEVIKGIGGGCDEEVIKLLKNAPKWTPGMQHGKVVRVQKIISIEVR